MLQLNQIMPGVISVTVPVRGKKPVTPPCTDVYFPDEIYDIEDQGEKLAAVVAEFIRANPL